MGSVYICPICRAEVTVIRDGPGRLEPVCCNVAMELRAERNPIYGCIVCGAEVAVIRDGVGELELRCCDRRMLLVR